MSISSRVDRPIWLLRHWGRIRHSRFHAGGHRRYRASPWRGGRITLPCAYERERFLGNRGQEGVWEKDVEDRYVIGGREDVSASLFSGRCNDIQLIFLTFREET